MKKQNFTKIDTTGTKILVFTSDEDFSFWAQEQAEKKGYKGDWSGDTETWENVWDELNLWEKWDCKYIDDKNGIDSIVIVQDRKKEV